MPVQETGQGEKDVVDEMASHMRKSSQCVRGIALLILSEWWYFYTFNIMWYLASKAT